MIFTKESLELLKSRIDLPAVLESFIELKRSGAAFKAICPFHDEKTPSFTVQKGDTHYHCFGCGAHGDAIAFLMNFQKLSFSDAVEYLASKFHVHLEKVESKEANGPSRKEMREALELACRTYHALLLHTEEGHLALKYLFNRGFNLEFVKRFEIGYALENPGAFHAVLKAKGISNEIAETCGLTRGFREFFAGRILFPIRAASGNVIGFSGRKIKEETFGGKYVNTPETPLFKKSRVLFGLNYSRSQIVKKRMALVVEGQIDALRLIEAGLNFVTASQGTAFGEGHVAELILLGINTVFLAFDSDKAGNAATAKVGDLFQKEGIEVKIVNMPSGYDPDLFVKEKGSSAFLTLMEQSSDYLAFLVEYHSNEIDVKTPAGKNELSQILQKQIRAWPHPLLVHESLKKLAKLLNVPENMVGVGAQEISHFYLKKTAYAGHETVDPTWVLETDLLAWLLKVPSESVENLSKTYLTPEAFQIPLCQEAFKRYASKKLDYFELSQLEEGQKLLETLSEKKIPIDKADRLFPEVLQRLLDRNWMVEREAIRMQIQSGTHSDEEALELARKFEMIKRTQPQIL